MKCSLCSVWRGFTCVCLPVCLSLYLSVCPCEGFFEMKFGRLLTNSSLCVNIKILVLNVLILVLRMQRVNRVLHGPLYVHK